MICFLLPSIYEQYKLENDGKEPEIWILNRGFIKFIVLFTAGINGAGAGILWTSAGKYIAECACDDNKGFYNAFFFGSVQSSNIFGSLIAGAAFRSKIK